MNRDHYIQCPATSSCTIPMCNDPQCGGCIEHLEHHAEREVDAMEARCDEQVRQLEAERAARWWFTFPDATVATCSR